MKKNNIKTIETNVADEKINYIVPTWIYNYLDALQPLGLKLDKIRISPTYSTDNVRLYKGDIDVYDYSKEAYFNVTYLNNIVTFSGGEIEIKLGSGLDECISYDDESDSYKKLYSGKPTSKNTAGVTLYCDTFDNVYLEVECYTGKKKFKGNYSFKHVDCYDSVENYFERISNGLNLSGFSYIVGVFVRTMLKDTRLHDELRSRLNKIPKRTYDVYDKMANNTHKKYKKDISDYMAKKMDQCSKEIIHLTNSMRNRQNFEESSIDDGSGLLVLRKIKK